METSAWKLLQLFLAFFLILPLPPTSSVFAGGGGLRVELRRVDANGNFSKIELLQRAARRSHHRLVWLAASSTGEVQDAQVPIHAGNGEFLMDVAIGTPPVAFSAIVDTGSDLIWTQCEPCVDCFDQPSPIFNPEKSSSYSKLPCSSSLCSALPSASCSSSGCEYLYTYGDSSSTQGILAADTFSLGSPSPEKIVGIAFGCGNYNQGAGFSQGGGLVGLGHGPLSLVSQLGLGRFSYCLTSLDASQSSPLLFGSLAGTGAGVKSTKLVKNPGQPSFYFLSLKGISVGGEQLPIPAGTFDLRGDGTGGLIIDSGTSITYLEAEGYRVVKKAFLAQMKLPAVDGGKVGLDACFSAPAGAEAVEVPKLVLHFDGGADLELPAENYMILDSPTGLLCLTVMGSRGMSILGNFQQQNMQVVYNLEKGTLSFEPTQCDKL